MNRFSAFDHACMTQALRLAENGLCTTRPNPRVGCVLAVDHEIIGRGWHRRAGGPHAEVFALREAGDRARGATAYVTLEPCAHHGRTPPCADALIAAGVKRVVVAVRDPFPEVDGRGLERLRAAGIEVDISLLEDAARALNCGFFARVERGRPWLRLKLACSLDGRIAMADGASKWITGPAARADVQEWRARSCAILTGAETVRRDDPRLNVRIETEFVPPVRVIVAGRARLPADAALWKDGLAPNLLVVPEAGVEPQALGCEVLSLPSDARGVDLPALMKALAARGINEIHTECGARLAGGLIDAGLVDELLVYQAPVLLGDDALPMLRMRLPDLAARLRLQRLETVAVGDDLRMRFRISSECSSDSLLSSSRSGVRSVTAAPR